MKQSNLYSPCFARYIASTDGVASPNMTLACSSFAQRCSLPCMISWESVHFVCILVFFYQYYQSRLKWRKAMRNADLSSTSISCLRPHHLIKHHKTHLRTILDHDRYPVTKSSIEPHRYKCQCNFRNQNNCCALWLPLLQSFPYTSVLPLPVTHMNQICSILLSLIVSQNTLSHSSALPYSKCPSLVFRFCIHLIRYTCSDSIEATPCSSKPEQLSVIFNFINKLII